jgi:hypothetical protein
VAGVGGGWSGTPAATVEEAGGGGVSAMKRKKKGRRLHGEERKKEERDKWAHPHCSPRANDRPLRALHLVGFMFFVLKLLANKVCGKARCPAIIIRVFLQYLRFL